MRVVYLAAPYRADTEHGVYLNIHEASEIALEIWRRGAVCFCPQKNTAFYGGAAGDDLWLAGDLEILRRCDAVFLAPRWRESAGAMEEVQHAERIGMPVFADMAELSDWLRSERGKCDERT